MLVVDCERATNLTQFVEDLRRACTILGRTRLPLIVAFNKLDVAQPTDAWKLLQNNDADVDMEDAELNSLRRSLRPLLNQFSGEVQSGKTKSSIRRMIYFFQVFVSSFYEQGHDAVMTAISNCVQMYKNVYVPMFQIMNHRRAVLVSRNAERGVGDV
ncbi:unnamed protein product [Caenorhabditis nigoni]